MTDEAQGFSASVKRAYRRLRGGKLSPGRFALSVSVGLFVGSLPLYGTHFLLCMALCAPVRLDVLVAYAAAHISIPPFIPFLLFAGAQAGSFVLTGNFLALSLEEAKALGAVELGVTILVGSVLVGLALALVGGLVAYVLALGAARAAAAAGIGQDGETENGNDAARLKAAVARVVARYRDAAPSQKNYVRFKLPFDPLTKQLFQFAKQSEFQLGSVLDAGCGRGQFSLLLCELGATESIVGFDLDGPKVSAAMSATASGDQARYQVGDLTTEAFVSADTVLLLDVLHYLPKDVQADVLKRAAAAVLPGGSVVVRETNQQESRGALWARLFERIGRALGINRGRGLDFQSPDFLIEVLSNAGLSVQEPEAKGPLDNIFLVAKRNRL